MKKTLAALAILAGPWSIGAAQAEIITYTFSATQTFTSGIPGSGSLAESLWSVTSLTGTFSYDDAAGDLNANPTYGVYQTGSISFDQVALPPSFMNATGLIQIFDQMEDTLLLTVNAANDESINLQLTGDGGVFDSDGLPENLNLSDFISFSFIEIIDQTSCCVIPTRVGFSIDSLQRVSMSEVPVPAAFFLFAAPFLLGAGRFMSSRKF